DKAIAKLRLMVFGKRNPNRNGSSLLSTRSARCRNDDHRRDFHDMQVAPSARTAEALMKSREKRLLLTSR
ncbi:MAG TPA: hypothetical protein VI256_12225, partial [Roseiarcus sp.]